MSSLPASLSEVGLEFIYFKLYSWLGLPLPSRATSSLSLNSCPLFGSYTWLRVIRHEPWLWTLQSGDSAIVTCEVKLLGQ